MIEFIDANCMVGRRVAPREGSLCTTEEILNSMDNCGISQTLCYHSIARESNVSYGNYTLKQVCADTDRFLHQWVVLPNVWDEFMEPDVLMEEMKKENVKSVRMYPRSMGFSLKPYASGKLIKKLTECNVPIFVDHGQISSAEEVYNMCQEYPDTIFVICEPGYRCVRNMIPVLMSCPKLYLESSSFVVNNGVQKFCETVGADRMIFGSGFPNGSLAAAASMIRYADISEEEKSLIASGNIKRLLGEVAL